MVKSNWYTATDVMILLEVKQTKAYAIIKDLNKKLSQTKIPGTDRYYSCPGAGKIRKSFFCETFMLDEKECDEIIAEAKKHSMSA